MAKRHDARLISALAAVPLFSDCNKSQLRTVADAGKLLTRRAGSTIAKAGVNGVSFFVILDGSVNIVRDDTLIARLEAGDFVGEMALLSDDPRNADIVANTDVEMFTFTRWTFKSLVSNNPAIGYNVMKTIAARQSIL